MQKLRDVLHMQSLRGINFFKKAVELQKKYNRKNLQVNNAFQTNGLAIDEEWCRFFAERSQCVRTALVVELNLRIFIFQSDWRKVVIIVITAHEANNTKE